MARPTRGDPPRHSSVAGQSTLLSRRAKASSVGLADPVITRPYDSRLIPLVSVIQETRPLATHLVGREGWRPRWDLNPRVLVLQTSALVHLATRSIWYRREDSNPHL